MSATRGPGRPPILLGCSAAAFIVLLLGGFAVVTFLFLDSGADSGILKLNVPAAYAVGSVEFIGEHNVYLVKLRDGSFLALSDLDAANRATPQRRCRVSQINTADPVLPGLLDKYGPGFSKNASGAALLFREICNGALYDLTGLRVDRDGPPLDRFPVATSADGHLTVDVSRRQCASSGLGPFAACR